MKILLALMCGLMALFAGGCAVILFAGAGYDGIFQSMPFALVAGGIAALNVLVLVALFGSSKLRRWPFYVLAGLDAFVVLDLVIVWVSLMPRDKDLITLLIAGGGVFALKAVLTIIAVRRMA